MKKTSFENCKVDSMSSLPNNVVSLEDYKSADTPEISDVTLPNGDVVKAENIMAAARSLAAELAADYKIRINQITQNS